MSRSAERLEGKYEERWKAVVKRMMNDAELVPPQFAQEYHSDPTTIIKPSGGILSPASMTAAATAKLTPRARPMQCAGCPRCQAILPVLETRTATYDRYVECCGKRWPIENVDLPF